MMMVQQAAKIIAATLIQGIVILGFVCASLGIGSEGHVGIGPDRPPRPVIPASVLPPIGGDLRLTHLITRPGASGRAPVALNAVGEVTESVDMMRATCR